MGFNCFSCVTSDKDPDTDAPENNLHLEEPTGSYGVESTYNSQYNVPASPASTIAAGSARPTPSGTGNSTPRGEHDQRRPLWECGVRLAFLVDLLEELDQGGPGFTICVILADTPKPKGLQHPTGSANRAAPSPVHAQFPSRLSEVATGWWVRARASSGRARRSPPRT
eukprot:1181295-Prorocentrum_minimum.AAC.3